MSEGHSFLRRFELQSVSFQDDALYLPVADPDKREINYTAGTGNSDGVWINGTFIEVSSLCQTHSGGLPLVSNSV